MCPGIGNSSETVALRTFSHRANECGFRVAVLNHLGVIPDIPLTRPRIFSYGRVLPLFHTNCIVIATESVIVNNRL